MKMANGEERRILQNYVDRCKVLHGAITIWIYFTSVSFILGPMLLPQTFPTDAVYPFPVDSYPVKVFIYLHQSLVGLQTSAAVSLDCMLAVLLWFLGARFEILSATLASISTFDDLILCIRKHQELFRCASINNCAIILTSDEE